MGRPFIEFIQAQALPWEPGRVPGRAGVAVRQLSADADTGAGSLLLRYPSDWSLAEGSALDVDEELFVLAGDLTIGQVRHVRFGYAHLPAGYPRGRMATSGGAVVLTFFSGAAGSGAAGSGAAGSGSAFSGGAGCDAAFAGGAGSGGVVGGGSGPDRSSGGPGRGYDEARLIERASAFEGEWGGNFHPRFPPGAGRKFLRQDARTGEETWILGTMPLRSGRRPERHPVVEEMYLLSGELVGPVGVMHAGAYFWRPPEQWHGPFGSPTGNLMLFRTHGGPLSTTYTEHEVEFSWSPPHRPILPAHLGRYGRPLPTGCSAY